MIFKNWQLKFNIICFCRRCPVTGWDQTSDYATRLVVQVERHETGAEHDDIDDVIRSFKNRKKKKKIWQCKILYYYKTNVTILGTFLRYIKNLFIILFLCQALIAMFPCVLFVELFFISYWIYIFFYAHESKKWNIDWVLGNWEWCEGGGRGHKSFHLHVVGPV